MSLASSTQHAASETHSCHIGSLFFLFLLSIPLHLFIHSPADGHLGHFQCLAVVNKGVKEFVCICAQVLVWARAFLSFGWTLRHGIAGSHGKYMAFVLLTFKYLKVDVTLNKCMFNCMYTSSPGFQDGRVSLHSHQPYTRILVAHQHVMPRISVPGYIEIMHI